eukprot:NODE_3883_length_868_cov_24.476190_g3223_i0.p2 GENE.NODE_3883_length_868_cov_24.476190_g3223_i0~~NODE_3883_length_868_cov_24.476190_g3223_i0.p2  ORF type:complete len:206 (+),score=52.02 NODE_3883_length_868_cov_24.476190_g3223_i0:149-766(+)
MSKKVLQADSLGPSIHKNEFRSPGVLTGNWVEDRAAYQRTSNDQPKFDANSESRARFTPMSTDKVQSAPTPDLPPALIFSHGGNPNQRQFVTTQQLSFQEPASSNSTVKASQASNSAFPPEAAGVPSTGRTSLLEKKQQQWAKDRGETPEAQFNTTKGGTIDESAKLISPTDVQARRADKWGGVAKEQSASYHRIGLRGDARQYS